MTAVTLKSLEFPCQMGIFNKQQKVEFGRYNLIYGFNGTGKTTLSRIFRSLENGRYDEKLPQGGRFRLILSDGKQITRDTNLDSLKDRTLVFNRDFTEENFKWVEGKATAIFYLGEKQIERKNRLEKLEREIESKENELPEKRKKSKDIEKELRNLLSSTGRQIEKCFSGRQAFDTRHVKKELKNYNKSDDDVLSEKALDELKKLISERDAPQPIETIELRKILCLESVSKWFESTIDEVALEDLRGHDEMLPWLKTGLEYHETHDLEACLFCANPLTPERLRDLRAIIQKSFAQFQERGDELSRQCDEFGKELDDLRNRLPAVEDFAATLRDRARNAREALRDEIHDLIRRLDSLKQTIVEKQKRAAERLDGTTPVRELQEAIGRVEEALREVNLVVSEHNELVQKFSEEQERAKNLIIRHFLCQIYDKYEELRKKLEILIKDKSRLENEIRSWKTEKDNIEQQMRDHHEAAESINNLLFSYFGHQEIKVKSIEDNGSPAYSLTRNGQPVAGTLSDGERTAITFCHFLARVNERGRDVRNCIIVLDDPVSSLDTGNLNYSVALIREKFRGAAQLFILTHNLHFMNEIKKWLRNDKRGKMFFIECHGGVDRNRESYLVDMPRHLIDYDSEYQYLFHLILEFTQDGSSSKFFYAMPNVLRKILETFLAFRFPGKSRLSEKIAEAKEALRSDDLRVRAAALERLTQLESHADSVEDVISLSPMTVEELKKATKALLNIMEELDPEHYQKMVKLCKRAVKG